MSFRSRGSIVTLGHLGWVLGGASIAASWIWAPALFVSIQMAYQKGLAGIFWFTVPNVMALAIFAFLAPRIRHQLPEGYTFPQYIKQRLSSERVHKLFLFPYFFYQLMAVTVQIYAGGSLLSLLTGISLNVLMPLLLLIALTYTLISGLVATVVTDCVHMVMIYLIGGSIVAWTCVSAGGLKAVSAGMQGIEAVSSIFDPTVAFSFGIVTSIGLLSGAICDQQYWQRSFAIKEDELRKAFIFGSMLFAAVPIGVSILGFLAANPQVAIKLPAGADVALIGVATVAHFLPGWGVILFVLMVLSALSSSLDSGLSATSSLWITDVVKSDSNVSAVKSARLAMIGISILGLAVAFLVQYIPGFGLKQLWWVFNTISACVAVPTLLSLYWDKLSERGVFWGVLVAFVVGLPLFIYGNVIDKPMWIVGASVFIIAITTLFCVIMAKKD
jgi:urea-proton symporter